MPSKKDYYKLLQVQTHENHANITKNCPKIFITCSIILTFLLLLLLLLTPPLFFRTETLTLTLDVEISHRPSETNLNFTQNSDECVGKYIFVQDLPTQFNRDFLENCTHLNIFTNACKLLENSGLGPRLLINSSSSESVFSGFDWFSTDQFSLEVIFHNRMKQYKCLTNDSSKANAVFVPYYAGLDVGRYLWDSNTTTHIDKLSTQLVEFITKKPEWKRFGGRDHFLIAGRITWDFSRKLDNNAKKSINGWGNKLLNILEIKNMTSLLLESNPNSKSEIAIPYPTYFHPSSRSQLKNWQEKLRMTTKNKRELLFSFAGGPRPNMKESIRNVLIDQCLAAAGQQPGKNCKYIHTGPDVKPDTVIGLFRQSIFCLQPPGDSYTRKSIFDSILAGCIPVLFHPGSAYVQYVWHLPKDYSSYSVFIPMDGLLEGNVSIQKVLLGFSKEKIRAMRENVIKLIPRIIYANPDSSKLVTYEDAFDLALKGVFSRVERIKTELMKGGKTVTLESSSVPSELAWKYNFFGDLNNHDWDKYFG